jgi:hypothetical protein
LIDASRCCCFSLSLSSTDFHYFVGIWSIYRDGTEWMTGDANTFRGLDDGQIFVVGDNYGHLCLFRYPCLHHTAISKKYWVSSSPVTRIRFASGDNIVISLAGDDKGIFQWKHIRDRSENIAYQTGERRGLLQEDSDDVSDWLVNYTELSVTENLLEELKSLVSVRPWIGSIVEPTNLHEQLQKLEIVNSVNSVALSFYHIYGIQCQINRNSNIYYTASHDLLYANSRYGVVYNKKMNNQMIYNGHESEEICAITVSNNGRYAASVGKSKRPCIHIWDTNTAQVITILPFLHRKGVISLAFSSDQKMLISTGADDDHSIALWISYNGNWFDGQLLTWNKGDINPVLFCNFYINTLKDIQFLLASGGRFHLKFWVLDGNTLNPIYAEYGKQIKIGTLLCGNAVGRKYVTGSTIGHLLIWKGRTLDRMIRAHERSITGIRTLTASNNATGKRASSFLPSLFLCVRFSSL